MGRSTHTWLRIAISYTALRMPRTPRLSDYEELSTTSKDGTLRPLDEAEIQNCYEEALVIYALLKARTEKHLKLLDDAEAAASEVSK